MPFTIRKKISRDILQASILNQLCKNGKAIHDLDVYGDIAKTGNTLQTPYANKNIWHTFDDLKSSVAAELEIGTDLFGPNRRNDDFNRRMFEVLFKLRRDKIISEWSDINHKHVIRLTDFETCSKVRVLPPLVLDVPSPTYDKPSSAISFGEEIDMKRIFGTIMTRGVKDNTYKFALTKIILDYCKNNTSYDIQYGYLAQEFLRHYWYQEYKYRIKQDFKTKSKPEVINILHDVFNDKDVPADFGQLDRHDIQIAKKKILQKVFGHARKKTSLVVPRLQNIRGDDGDTVEYNIFYNYDDDVQMIYLRPEAHDFFKRNYSVLSMTTIAAWAKFLERINGTIPRLMSKIESPDKKRGSMYKYYKMLNKHENCCFYCQTTLEKNNTHVDHFIPWSYIFEDELWNLVLACKHCNSKKSNNIASEEFKNLLVDRNKKYHNVINQLQLSLERLDRGRGWRSEINYHYDMCLAIEPGRISLP